MNSRAKIRDRARRRWCSVAAAAVAASLGASAMGQTRTQGIDVSHFQNQATAGGVLGWSSVAASGVQFTYIKASEGLTVDDASFVGNISGAFNAGLIVGAYHLAHPENNTPQQEITHFISKAGPYISAGYLRPTLDLEFGTSNMSFAQISTWSQTWLTGIEQQTGIRPIIYTLPSYAVSLSSSLNAYNLWIEAYGQDPATNPANLGVWNPNWTIWQKSDTGTVSGITGNVDLDEYNGSRDSLIDNLVAPFVWGAANSGTWSTPGSWLNAFIAPHTNADVIFSRNATVTATLSGASAAHSIWARAGSYTINTAGNSLALSDELDVATTAGDAGSLTLSGGGAVSCVNGFLGGVAGSSGALTVSGATLNVSGDLCLGGTTMASSSTSVGTASVSAGGTINVAGTLRIYNTSGTQFGINGGTVNTAALATDSNPALILSSWTAGTLNITGTAGLTIGTGGPLGTTVSIATGRTLSVVNTLTIGPAGALTVSGGAVNAGNISLVAGGGTSTALHVTGGNVNCGVLSIGGSTSMTVSAGANSVIHIGSMTVAQTKLDLADNKLIATSESVGSWNGTNYDGITGLIKSGRNSGFWTGFGIVTSLTAASAASHLTTLAVATAGEVGKTTFGGQSVAPSDVLVMYTYTGDANLDGKINADDYFQIDSHYNKTDNGSKSYFDGDFNYDGKINGDDYFLIDSSFHAQGAAFSSGEIVGAAGVQTVPEPVGLSFILLGVGVGLRNRRSTELTAGKRR